MCFVCFCPPPRPPHSFKVRVIRSCARARGGRGGGEEGAAAPPPSRQAHPFCNTASRELCTSDVSKPYVFCAHIGAGLLIVQPPLVATTKRTPHVISLFALLGGHSHANFACDVLFSLSAATAMRFRWKFHSHANFACVLCFMCPLGRHTHANFM